MVEEDLFLEDLYYRLLDFPIDVPPLRERADDILLLARHYVERTAEELGRPAPRMTRAFASQLRSWSWPGNVRELERSIRRTGIMAGGEERLQRALDAVGWNRSEAARRLKISYPTLLQKIKVYGLKNGS